MWKQRNLLAMKKNLSKIFFVLFVSGCGVKGVENDTAEGNELIPTDTIKTEVNDIVMPVDSLQVNFDSVFTFTDDKPVDSLVLKSGVKIVFIKHGTKNPVKKYDVAALNYRGTLTNGKMIESNEQFKKAIPFVVGLGMTFEAFDEVLQKCNYGDKIRFTIPSEKAYGKKGRGEIIPPNSDLIYEMDIVQRVEGKKTKSGIEYFNLFGGDKGSLPKEGDNIVLSYMGWVKKTGRLFDASAANGKLYEFVLGTGTAIKAWHEAVAVMKEGEKILIIAPAETCYGSRGVQELVPPNSDLIYILELKRIEPKK
jgi:FKBP-type peptidyl-prolyl cis-trans isomerase